jgi:enoyl-CoA hydratase
MREFVSIHSAAEHPGVAALVLSRPPTNAMTRQAYREIAAAAAELGRRDDIAAVILFGGHEIFSAGDHMPELRTLSPSEAETAARVRCEAVDAVASIPKPTVAAITGYALGAGLTLALAADWRISGDNVKFGATEILAGLIPGGGGMARLTRAIGASRAKELVFSGRFFDAEEALALGLIDEMVAPDDVYDAAAGWARRFVDSPPEALAAAKAGINDVFGLTSAEWLAAEQRRYIEVFAAWSDCPASPRAVDRPASSPGGASPAHPNGR